MNSDPSIGVNALDVINNMEPIESIEPNLQQLHNPQVQQESRKRKRRRKVLVCEPCHRHKQKCDRKEPCSRCIASDRVSSCTYAALPPPQTGYDQDHDNREQLGHETILSILSRHQQSGAPDLSWQSSLLEQDASSRPGLLLAAANALEQAGEPRREEHPVMSYTKGKVRCSGFSHWAQMVFQFEEMRPYMFSRSTALAEVKKRERAVKRLFPKRKPRAFPFGDSSVQSTYSQSNRLTNLPSQEVVESLLDHYLDTIEKLFPLYHAATLREELHRFWKEPSTASNAWLAQLYLILALSCYANPKDPYDEAGGYSALIERLIDGAEACFTQTSFLYRPDIVNLTHVRVLVMIIIAHQLEMIGTDGEGTWVLMGFVVRSSMVMWLHRNPSSISNMSKLDVEMRKRVWTTITQLDLTVAVHSGRLLQCRPDEFSTPAPSVGGLIPETHFVEPLDPDECRFQQSLSSAFPLLSSIISRVNSPWPSIAYSEVMKLDSQLRNLISQAESQPVQQEGTAAGWRRLQQTTFSNMVRRVRLALHQPIVQHGTNSEEAQNSHFIILECALAILVHHNGLYYDERLCWASELFQEDLRIATVHVCVGLRQKIFFSEPVEGTTVSPQRTAWEALCQELKQCERSLDRSLSHMKAFLGFSVMKAIVENMDSPDPRPTLEVIHKAAFDAYDIVEARMQAKTKTSLTSQISGPSSGSLEDGVNVVTPLDQQQLPLIDPLVYGTNSIDPALRGNGMVLPDFGLNMPDFLEDWFEKNYS